MRSHRYRRSAARRAYSRNLHLPHICSVLGILALAVAGLVIIVAGQTVHAAPSSGAIQTTPTGDYPGSPAIRLMKAGGGPITAADVAKYVQTAGMPRTRGPRNPITDVHAELLASAQIRVRLHGESTGYSDNTALWFVQMRGTFVFPGPQDRSVTAHIGYQVFDPVSGNLVMFGGLG